METQTRHSERYFCYRRPPGATAWRQLSLFHNYDFVAPIYPLLERAAFGQTLDEARNAFLDPAIFSKRVLLIGEGNGRFLAHCLQHKVGGSITIIDLSGKMLSLLRSRVCRINCRTALQFVQGDFRDWQPDELLFDAIVTHFFLDLFRPNSQRHIVEKIAAISQPEAVWVNVDFRPGLGSPMHRLLIGSSIASTSYLVESKRIDTMILPS
jgi:ubiquinone/menaquinone biosynthesis C-methylase UbiE